jgi:hypothetical protein
VAVNYALGKPAAGALRSAAPSERSLMVDISDTVANVGTRLGKLEEFRLAANARTNTSAVTDFPENLSAMASTLTANNFPAATGTLVTLRDVSVASRSVQEFWVASAAGERWWRRATGTSTWGAWIRVPTLDDIPLPRPWWRAERTTASATVTTEVSLVNLGPLTLATNRLYKISASVEFITQSVAGDVFQVQLKNGNTSTTLAAARGTGIAWNPAPFAYFTGNGLNHTYQLTLRRITGTGTGTLNAATTTPTTLLLEEVADA